MYMFKQRYTSAITNPQGIFLSIWNTYPKVFFLGLEKKKFIKKTIFLK